MEETEEIAVLCTDGEKDFLKVEDEAHFTVLMESNVGEGDCGDGEDMILVGIASGWVGENLTQI